EKMMAKDMNARFQTWNEAISFINTTCPDLLGAPMPAASSLAKINISALSTGRFEAFGQPAGEFADEKKKTVRLKTGKIRKRNLADTIAKFNPAIVAGINSHWKSALIKTREADKTAAHVFIAVVGVIFAVVTMFSIILIINMATKPSTPPPQDQSIIPNVIGPSVPAGKNESAEPVQKAGAAVKTTKAPASSPEKTFKEICDFYDSNPEANMTEAYTRFNVLKSASIKTNDIKLIQDINDKQQAIELLKKQKVASVIEKLRTETAPLIKGGEQARAFEIIEKYPGEFAEESLNERRTLISSLKTTVSEINITSLKADLDSCMGLGNFDQAELLARDFKGKTDDETLKQRQELSNYVEDRKVKFTRGLSPLYNEAAINFMSGKNEVTLEKIRTFLGKPELPPESASFAGNLSRNISSFKNLSQATSPLDEKIKVCDSLIKGDSSILKGMLCMQEKSYDRAKEFFKGVKCNLASSFINAATEREAELALIALLSKYDMAFNPEKPEQFLLELTQKKVQLANAANLVSALSQYNDRYMDTAFLKKHENIMEAVRKFCKRAGAEDTDAARKSVTVQEEDPQSSAYVLSKYLSEKVEGMSITLKQGVYHADKLREFSIIHNGTKISGEPGTVIKNNILITAKDITVSGITLDGGWIACTDNAKNITFKNCVFKSDLTKIMTCSTISFQNCLFKGLLIDNSSGVYLNHCTILAIPTGPEKSASLWIKGNTDVEINNSIIYADGCGIAFTNPDNSKDRRISNTLWYGEEGLCGIIVNNKIDDKEKVESDKKIRLPKYFKVKNNLHVPPQFVDDKKGVWRLIKGVPGTKKADDGKDCGMVFEE
ncbi:MAG: right-handed parallel beta-helix repeat-containing protein, partial [Victivallales bacterium]